MPLPYRERSHGGCAVRVRDRQKILQSFRTLLAFLKTPWLGSSRLR